MMEPLLAMTACLSLCVSAVDGPVLGRGAPPEPQQAASEVDAYFQRLSQTVRKVILIGVTDKPEIFYSDRLADQKGQLEIGDSIGLGPYSFKIIDILLLRRSAILMKIDGTIWEWKLGNNLASVQRIRNNKAGHPPEPAKHAPQVRIEGPHSPTRDGGKAEPGWPRPPHHADEEQVFQKITPTV